MVTISHGASRISCLCMGGEFYKLLPSLLEALFCLLTSIFYKMLTHILHVLIYFFSSDFHDYHHRLLYTKSGNYSSTFVYMDW